MLQSNRNTKQKMWNADTPGKIMKYECFIFQISHAKKKLNEKKPVIQTTINHKFNN